MKIFYDTAQQLHDPQFFLVRGQVTASAEQPARADRLLAALTAAGRTTQMPERFGPGPRAAIHTPEYLDFLSVAYDQWQALDGASTEIIANIHPGRYPATYPRDIVGRAGWHQADTSCPIGQHTWSAARAAADCAVAAAQAVLDGDRAAYALCRPPGHHAYADMAGGFCFLNNSAIAAQWLRQRHDRVAILDVDVHSGNGTQGIFWDRADVLTISIHGDPNHLYPFFWGHATERGGGRGEGFNLNLPLPPGAGDHHMLSAIEVAASRIALFAPGALVVPLGLDAFEQDPLGNLSVSTEGFGRIGTAIARLGLPTVFVQEGGYLCDPLGDNLVSVLDGFDRGA